MNPQNQVMDTLTIKNFNNVFHAFGCDHLRGLIMELLLESNLENREIMEHLIMWKTLSTKDVTWEYALYIDKNPQLINIEGNASLKRRGA